MKPDATKKQPTDAQWKRLFYLADQVKRLSPWEWMQESDVFGVREPSCGEVHFISVMGAVGEHFALTAYCGWGDLERFWLMQDVDESVMPEFMFETTQLMLSFENRETLEQRDRELIRRLGLKYRGRNAWPQFRVFRPGYYPWYLVERAEADQMIVILEQSLGVMMRVEDDPGLLMPDDPETLFVRQPVTGEKAGKAEWEDVRLEWPEPERMLTYYEVESTKMDAVSALPRSEGSVEIDYFLSDAPVGSRNERPMCAYVLLMTDAKTGYVLGTEILHATDGLEGMLSRIPSKMLDVFSRAGSIPESIAVSRPVLSQILAPFEDRLAIEVDLTDSLPATTEARRSLGEFLR